MIVLSYINNENTKGTILVYNTINNTIVYSVSNTYLDSIEYDNLVLILNNKKYNDEEIKKIWKNKRFYNIYKDIEKAIEMFNPDLLLSNIKMLKVNLDKNNNILYYLSGKYDILFDNINIDNVKITKEDISEMIESYLIDKVDSIQIQCLYLIKKYLKEIKNDSTRN